MTTQAQPWLRNASLVFLHLFNLPLIVLVAMGAEAVAFQIEGSLRGTQIAGRIRISRGNGKA